MKKGQIQTAANNYNISQAKPSVPKSATVLTGWIANSMNAGHYRPIAYKRIMAGEKHYEYKVNLNLKLLTPKTPPMQRLNCTVEAFFVPDSAVWDNAEKFVSQKGGASEIKIQEYPNFDGKEILAAENIETNKQTPFMNTTIWRDSWISSYLGRQALLNEISLENGGAEINLPKQNALVVRGYPVIYNNFLRNKEYDEEIPVYKTDIVFLSEMETYIPNNWYDYQTLEYMFGRAKRPNSYYTDYRTELQGFEESYPPTDMSADKALINWMNWEQLYAAAKSQAEDVNLTDWQVLAKIRGSKLLTEGKPQKLASKTFNLNYSAVTQNAYNNSENVDETFRALGQQGAYSYTEVELPLYQGVEFNEEGTLHVIAWVWAETVFEKGIDRTLLNTNWKDIYRPDLKEDKNDVLYELEFDSAAQLVPNASGIPTVRGFKRKYSEYVTKLPNVIAGDMTSDNYFESDNRVDRYTDTQVITQKTYQFFERSDVFEIMNDGTVVGKQFWKDYSDLMVNKNQVVQNPVWTMGNALQKEAIRLKGQNQIFFVGTQTCMAELPIDSSIAENFSEWGSH